MSCDVNLVDSMVQIDNFVVSDTMHEVAASNQPLAKVEWQPLIAEKEMTPSFGVAQLQTIPN